MSSDYKRIVDDIESSMEKLFENLGVEDTCAAVKFQLAMEVRVFPQIKQLNDRAIQLQGERDRQYGYNTGAIAKIAKLEAQLAEAQGERGTVLFMLLNRLRNRGSEGFDIHEVIQEWLEGDGHDGLCQEDIECGCSIDDLGPCSNIGMDCAAANLEPAPEGSECDLMYVRWTENEF